MEKDPGVKNLQGQQEVDPQQRIAARPEEAIKSEEAIDPRERPIDYLWNLPGKRVGQIFRGRDYAIKMHRICALGEPDKPGQIMLEIYAGDSDPDTCNIPQESYHFIEGGLMSINCRNLPSTDPSIAELSRSLGQRERLKGDLGSIMTKRVALFVQDNLSAPRPPSEREKRLRARAAQIIQEKKQQGSTTPALDAFFETARVTWFEEGAAEKDPELLALTHYLADAWNEELDEAMLRQSERVKEYWDRKLNPQKARADDIIQEYTDKGSDHPALDAWSWIMQTAAEDTNNGGDLLQRDDDLPRIIRHLYEAMDAEINSLTGQKQVDALRLLEERIAILKVAFPAENIYKQQQADVNPQEH